MTDQHQSSNETVNVDTDKLKPAIAKFNDLASRLKSVGTGLDLICQSYGEPWGDDKAGKEFYGKYEKPHADLIDAAHDAGAGFSIAADSVGKMVKAFEDIGDQAGAQGRRLRLSVDPGTGQDPPPAPNE
ncbi:hypothetical protein ABZ845_21790 [Streptomyces sp. NPDC047022]|uniref:hypothetical protein n=1 Tax=Streptomyces sp. NPDC047022 TaxID=3155737 RepID=UPI0033FB3F70